MSNVTIDIALLRGWQSRLENIDGALSISEEMYDVINKLELEVNQANEKQKAFLDEMRAKDAKKVTMREVVVGDEYRISQDANFKDKFNVLKGAVVKIIMKKRTNVSATIMSDVRGYKGMTFNININALETL